MIVILYNIRSIYNVASIFRTADAIDVEKIYLCGITPSPKDEMGRWRKDFLKVSLGREKTILWEKKKSAVTVIKKLKEEGYKIFSIEQSKKSIPYYKIKIKDKNFLKKVVLILGHERGGISRNIIFLSDKIIEIPMGGSKKESLNVGIAFAIAGFHLYYS